MFEDGANAALVKAQAASCATLASPVTRILHLHTLAVAEAHGFCSTRCRCH
jgi:hypothetical protein